MKAYATYLRVSTQRQGRSGLGLDAQRKMCADFVMAQGGVVDKEFVDVESGTHRNRKGLQDAISYCKKNDCPLVIAKLDRLARDVEFCFRVVNTGIQIHFTDMPVINSLLLGVFAAVAQYERELTSDRTRKALAVKKQQGCKLGAANETYRINLKQKDKEVRKKECMERGQTKRTRFQESKDTTTFLRVLRNVFPDATTSNNPAEWAWGKITTRNGYRERILAMMRDYKEFDDGGTLFRKWNFDDDEKTLMVQLCGLIQRTRKSFGVN